VRAIPSRQVGWPAMSFLSEGQDYLQLASPGIALDGAAALDMRLLLSPIFLAGAESLGNGRRVPLEVDSANGSVKRGCGWCVQCRGPRPAR
jgi:hypothetical protein